MALRLVNVEDTLHALTHGELDAVVDPQGKMYLLRTAQEHLQAHHRRLNAILGTSESIVFSLRTMEFVLP